MLRHIALITFHPGTPASAVEALIDGLAALPEQIPSIRAYAFGRDAGLGQDNDEFAIVADFDDADGYRAYASDPAHQAVIVNLLRPIRATRHGIQFYFDP